MIGIIEEGKYTTHVDFGFGEDMSTSATCHIENGKIVIDDCKIIGRAVDFILPESKEQKLKEIEYENKQQVCNGL